MYLTTPTMFLVLFPWLFSVFPVHGRWTDMTGTRSDVTEEARVSYSPDGTGQWTDTPRPRSDVTNEVSYSPVRAGRLDINGFYQSRDGQYWAYNGELKEKNELILRSDRERRHATRNGDGRLRRGNSKVGGLPRRQTKEVFKQPLMDLIFGGNKKSKKDKNETKKERSFGSRRRPAKPKSNRGSLSIVPPKLKRRRFRSRSRKPKQKKRVIKFIRKTVRRGFVVRD